MQVPPRAVKARKRILRGPFIRGLEGDNLLEIFLVTSVASVLFIRFFLRLTGYPQLGGRGLHIAHVLLGGIFMLAAIIILLAFISKASSYLGAVLGGFGFGAFIDELGKFLTGDNNYFFQPTLALIYITFVLIYLIIEALNRPRALSPQEMLVNVLEITKDAVFDDLDSQERQRALDLLEQCPPSDSLVQALKDLLLTIESVPAPRPSPYTRAKIQGRRLYHGLVQKSWFKNAVIAFFVLQSLLTLTLNSTVLLMEALFGMGLTSYSFAGVGGLASAMVSAGLVAAGVASIRRSRLAAYQMFRNAVLVQIFLVQVFAFYTEQFRALIQLLINIGILLVLRYMIRQERSKSDCNKSNCNAAGTITFEIGKEH